VPGVEIWSGKRRLGTTGASGSARIALQRCGGRQRRTEREMPGRLCLAGTTVARRLRHLGNGSTLARFEVECFSLVHTVVVGLRAENGPRLPILRLKNVVGQTDEAGVAHLLLEASANEQIALTLDTSKNTSLLPQNPTLDFVTRDSDELVLWRRVYSQQPPERRPTPRAIPRHL